MEDVHALTVAVAELFVRGASGIYHIAAERSSENGIGDALPPVLPSQLIHFEMRAFAALLAEQPPDSQRQ